MAEQDGPPQATLDDVLLVVADVASAMQNLANRLGVESRAASMPRADIERLERMERDIGCNQDDIRAIMQRLPAAGGSAQINERLRRLRETLSTFHETVTGFALRLTAIEQTVQRLEATRLLGSRRSDGPSA